MAMVKISNGEVTQIVSRGAYESQYKKLGFEIVGSHKVAKTEKKAAEPEKVVNTPAPAAGDVDDEDIDGDENSDEDADDFEELLEKPLSQWSNEELKAFVNAKGIDTASAKKTSEVRSLVKKYLDDEAKKAAEA